MTLVASALAGGDCINDADALRAGGTARCAAGPVPGGRPAPAWPGGDCLECSFAVWLPPLVCQPSGQLGDSHGRAPLGFQDGRGHWEPAWTLETGTEECFRRNPLNCCLGSSAEHPGNRRAIRLLEPLIPPTPWGFSGSPEWGSWSQYQKDSGGDRKSAISGHLGGWPMEGVFFSYEVCPSDSVGVLRKRFSAF